MPRSTDPQYRIDAFLESCRERELDDYLDDIDDGLERPLTRAERRAEYFDLYHE